MNKPFFRLCTDFPLVMCIICVSLFVNRTLEKQEVDDQSFCLLKDRSW